MTYKHSIAMIKPWQTTGSLGAHLHEMIAKFSSAFKIPTGYEDESGFHLGAEPAKNEIEWPRE